MIPNTGRGTLGRLERIPKLDLENYQDFCEGVRKYALGDLRGPAMADVDQAISDAQAVLVQAGFRPEADI